MSFTRLGTVSDVSIHVTEEEEVYEDEDDDGEAEGEAEVEAAGGEDEEGGQLPQLINSLTCLYLPVSRDVLKYVIPVLKYVILMVLL